MVQIAEGLDVEGPVQAELFVVWLRNGALELTGLCGAAPWLIEVSAEDHPVDAVGRVVRGVLGDPMLIHSTSWRRERGAVVLSFVVVIDPAAVGPMESAPIRKSELARGGRTAAPTEIGFEQVVEHGLRHMAWLAQDDPVVKAELPSAWRAALEAYVPEPFRNLA